MPDPQKSTYATGRRKQAVARVWLQPGNGKVEINRRSLEDYFGRETSRMVFRQALELTETMSVYDIFVNVAGGVKLSEPAVDLGIIAAIASSFLDRPIDPKTVVFGEVGLTGEIRGINQMDVRIREAARMGFTRCIMPLTRLRDAGKADGIQRVRVDNLRGLMEQLF